MRTQTGQLAQSQCSKSSEAFLRQTVMTDVHSPDEFRTATVRNLDAWYAAFGVQPGDKLYLAPAGFYRWPLPVIRVKQAKRRSSNVRKLLYFVCALG
ncbi:MAG TPA: M13-type metalloendopeptidase [Terriglobales bacterium]|nr:M13-type metalloendopeptidase [Terriglobales bacterium]